MGNLRLLALAAALAAVGAGAVAHAQPAAEKPVAEAESSAAAGPKTPSLEDVDIDALLSPPDPGRADATRDPGSRFLAAVEESLADDRVAEIRSRTEDALLGLVVGARVALPTQARRRLDSLFSERWPPELPLLLAQLFGGAVIVLLTLRLLRGRGDVAVSVEYPSELRGTFTVRISPRRGRGRRAQRKADRVASAADAERAKRRARTASRTVHPLVSRETQFREVVAGRYRISVEGFIQAPDSEVVIANHVEEQDLVVRRGHTVRLEFDFHPRDCPVDVKVLWDDRPVEEAMVAVRGVANSLRYARGGPARLGVSRGTHELVVGSGDRVSAYPLEVSSFQPTLLTVDLADRERQVFTGCPPAVAPYLNGDTPAAARALERDGQVSLSHRLLAERALEENHKEEAASHFEFAGLHLRAADLRRDLSQFEHSATLYESAGETERAADMYRSAGELVLAGESYERAKRWESAAECFREAGEVNKWVESLENHGTPFAAAGVSIDRGDWGRAIRSLQLVTHSDEEYPEAARLLVDAYRREGHLDLAAAKLEELVRVRNIESVPLAESDQLVGALDENGETERALTVLELMRQRDATYPNVATRIEVLRKRRSREQSGARTQPGGDVGAFTSEFRYEILEEVGRGGMGIVFKARDRRLGRTVALKRLPENLRNHPKAVELFLREARAAAALNHPNIVTVYDAGQEGDAYYITMELLQGSPVVNILRKRGQLTPLDVCRLGVQIAAGLHYAHEQKIIHRDIKTANLFFTDSRKIKIMDFGLAKMLEEVRRGSTVIGGTPYYMSPEQSSGESADHRADIYAFGVTLYELVTGKVPFTEGDVAFHHRHTPVPDPRERAELVPDDLAELVLHMMAKSPDDRVSSTARVGERLQDIARGLTVG